MLSICILPPYILSTRYIFCLLLYEYRNLILFPKFPGYPSQGPMPIPGITEMEPADNFPQKKTLLEAAPTFRKLEFGITLNIK